MAAGPGCDAAIRSPSDSYSDAEIVIRAVPLSPEGANAAPASRCADRQPNPRGDSVRWPLCQRVDGSDSSAVRCGKKACLCACLSVFFVSLKPHANKNVLPPYENELNINSDVLSGRSGKL